MGISKSDAIFYRKSSYKKLTNIYFDKVNLLKLT